MSPHQWYYIESGIPQGEKAGPIAESQLVQDIRDGRLHPYSLLCCPTRDGSAWRRLKNVPALLDRWRQGFDARRTLRPNAQPLAFLSYARRDGEAFAMYLCDRLQREHADIILWRDREEMVGGRNWQRQISDALDQVRFLIVVMTPGALASPVTRWEWLEARRRGVCVFPVQVPDAPIDFPKLPGWMSRCHFYDLDHQWPTLVQHLHSPCEQARVPMMAPDVPDGFVERPDEFNALLAQLLDRERLDPIAITTALQGGGGFGKTTLAKALCHHDDVLTAFDDGILWTTLGRTPNLLENLKELYAALTGQRPAFVNQNDATVALKEKLDGRHCLLVIDDVWNAAHVQPFLEGGEGCARLITTRDKKIASHVTRGDQAPVKVDEMTGEQAVRMLLKGLLADIDSAVGWTSSPSTVAETTSPAVSRTGWKPILQSAQDLAARLGEWPILLEIVHGLIKSRRNKLVEADCDHVEALERAIGYVSGQLAEEGLTSLNVEDAEARNQMGAATIKLSLLELPEADRDRCHELSIFPEDIDVPLGAVAALWGTTPSKAERLADRLDDLSLLRLNVARGTLRLHDVVAEYLSGRLGDPAAVHARLIDQWGDLYRLPDEYAWRNIAYHLHHAGHDDRLAELLADFRWLDARLRAVRSQTDQGEATFDVASVLSDYEWLRAGSSGSAHLWLIRDAIRLSSHVLSRDADQLATQLAGRLNGQADPQIQRLLADARRGPPPPVFWPTTASLTPPGGPLIRTLEGHTFRVMAVAVTPDGRRAISASDDKTLRVWELASGQATAVLKGHTDDVRGVAVTPDGRRAISASDDKTLRVWDLASGQSIAVLKGHTSGVTGVVVTLDGRRAISASADRMLRVWDLASGQAIAVLEGHTDRVNAVAVTPDGRRAISASGKVDAFSTSRDKTVRVWDLASGQATAVLEGHTDQVNAVAVTPDGRRAITASSDKTLRVWDLASAQSIAVLEGHSAGVEAVAVTPDGRLAISASWDQTLRVWDLASGQATAVLEGHTSVVNAVAVTPDGRCVISASADRMLRVWDLASGQSTAWREGHTDQVNAVAVTPDGRRAISASDDNTLRVWDLASGQATAVLEGHTRAVAAVAVTPDGRRAISASNGTMFRVWDLASGQGTAVLKGHTSYVTGVALTPDGRRAVSASCDKTLRVWDLASGQATAVLEGHTDQVNAVAVTPDGRRAITASSDKTLRVWDLASGRPPAGLSWIARSIGFGGDLAFDESTAVLEGHTGDVSAVAVTPDGRLAISASWDQTLRVWDLASGQATAVLKGHTSAVSAVTVTPNGRRAISASHDNTSRVWDLASGQSTSVLEGHAVAVTPDGRRAISRSHYNTLRLWDLESGAAIATFTADGYVHGVAISPDGKTVVAGDSAGRVHFLDLLI